jgi:hypothetical protein
MFIDALCLLSDAQAVSADAASTNSYDCGNVTPKREISSGEPLCIAFAVDVAADVADGDETYEFQVIQSANSNLSSPDILTKTDTALVTRTVLVAGYKFYMAFTPQLVTKRYVGAFYNVDGTTPTITVTAVIQPLSMIQTDKTYAKGYTVS